MTTINTKQVIMGVDPGTNLLGYSVIHSDKNTMNILINGVLDLKKTEDHFQKLLYYNPYYSPLIRLTSVLPKAVRQSTDIFD